MTAAEHLTADLEVRRGNRFVKGMRFLANLAFMAVGASPDIAADTDLVVRRRDTGREVMRTPADVGDPEILVYQVRRDLESKTVEEFVAEWRLPDDAAS
jgi:hypothetical protein